MGLYKVTGDTVLVPVYSTVAGEPATHEDDEKDYVKNSVGEPDVFYLECRRGSYLYESSDDYNKLNEGEKEHATMVPVKATIRRFKRFDVIEEYKGNESQDSSSAESEEVGPGSGADRDDLAAELKTKPPRIENPAELKRAEEASKMSGAEKPASGSKAAKSK